MKIRKISIMIICTGFLILCAQSALSFYDKVQQKTDVLRVNEEQQLQKLDDVKALMKEKKWLEAERLAREYLAETEASQGENSLSVARVIDILIEAILADRTRTGGEAENLMERALSIREKTLGFKDPELVDCLFNYSRLFYRRGDYSSSRPYAERALKIAEELYGPKHSEVGRILHHYAWVLHRTGESTKAIESFKKSLEIKEEELGSEHLEISRILEDLCQVFMDIEQLKESRACLERALTILKKNLGSSHIDVADAAIRLGKLLHTMGIYAEALNHYESSLPIMESEYGLEHPKTALCLNDLGTLHKDMGNFIDAQKCHERALSIREKVFGEDHQDVAFSLNNLGVVLRRLGDYDRALELLERSFKILEKVYEADHPEVAMPLVNISNVLGESGDREGAEAYSKRAFEIKEKALGPYSMDLLPYLSNRSGNLRQLGRLDEAKELQERALMIMEKNLGSDHPDVAYFLTLHARLYEDMGDVKTSLALIERAQSIVEKSLGPDHPFLAYVVLEYAYYLWSDGQIDNALNKALRTHQIVCNRLHLMSLSLSEREVLEFDSSTSNGLGICLSSAVSDPYGKNRNADKAWDALIRSRALILDEMAARNYRIVEASDPNISTLAESFFTARQRLANLVIRGPSPEDAEEDYINLLEQTREEKERSERELAQASVSFREVLERSQAGLEEIKASLPAHSAVVAFAYYNHSEPPPKKEVENEQKKKQIEWDVPAYLAFVLHADEKDLSVIPLGRAEEIHPLFFDWAQEMKSGTRIPGRTVLESQSAYRSAGSALRQKIWDPIAPHVKDAACVLIVPDGYLHDVNFAALPVEGNRYLIENGPLIHYLSAELDLLSSGGQKLKGTGLLALGNPDFDEISLFDSLSTGDEPKNSFLSRPQSKAPFRGMSSATTRFRSMSFESLPATSQEINEITAMWRKRQGRNSDVVKLTQDMANETNFKISAPGRRILHIATHGFFLDSEESPESDLVESVTIENPLILTGLVLAGANHRYSAGPEEEDGILTAEEIATLDLRKVECVVLSACAAASWEDIPWKEAFGLRRAFRIAGAGTLISSLSPVEDEVARRWMNFFYDALLKKNLGAAEAAREASLEVLRRQRRRGDSSHPFYWAGFVASGDIEQR